MTANPYQGRGRAIIYGSGAGGSQGIPFDGVFILAVPHSDLPNARVLEDSATLEWDLTTSGIVRANVIGGGGGGGSGDVVGPASAVDDRFATFNGITGKLIQDSGLSAASFETAGAAAAAIAAHEGAANPHPTYLTQAEADALYATLAHTHAFTDVLSVPTARILGRTTAGTGAAEALTAASVKTFLDLTGTNSGDQTITLTGDVTGTGTGSFAATIGANKVTAGKMAASATNVLFGRATAGAGAGEEIALTAAGRALIDDADATAQRTTLGLGTLATQNGTFSGTSSGTNTGDQTITLTGDVTGSGTGSFAATVANNAISNAKLADVPTATFKGRATAATGDPEDLTVAQAKTLLNLTGTNSGDQTITLTGDVTGSGTGSFAATIANDAVTYAKMQNVSATDRLLGRSTAGAGNVEEIVCTAFARSILDDVDAAAVRATIGVGTGTGDALTTNPLSQFAATTSAQLAGVISDETGSGALVFASGPTFAGLSTFPNTGLRILDTNASHGLILAPGDDLTANRTLTILTNDANRSVNIQGDLTVNSTASISGTNTGDQTITLTGDVTGSGTGSFATTIANDAVTNAKLANVPTATFKGRTTAATGDPEDLTVAQAKTLLNLTGTNTGDQTITLTGDVTGSGTGSFAATVANNAVTNAKLADVPTATFKGRTTAATGDPEDLTVAQAKTLLNLTGTNSGDQTITLTGDVTGAGTGSFAATIANDAVTFAKMLNASAASVLIGRGSASGAGDFQEITLGSGLSMTGTVLSSSGGGYTDEEAQDAVGAMLDGSLTYVDGTPLLQRAALTGDVTASAGSNATTIAAQAVGVAKMTASATDVFFGRDTAGAGAGEEITVAAAKTLLGLTGTNTGDQTITLTGDVTGSGTGSFAATIAADAVTNAKLANVATATFKGRTTAGTGDPEDLTVAQAKTLLNLTGTNSGDEPSATTSLEGVVTLANDLEYTANEVIRADDLRITTSLFKKRQMQLLARFGPVGSPALLDAVGMPVPAMSGNGVSQIIPSTTYCVVRFLANAGINSYRQYLDLPTGGGGGLLRTGFDAICGWVVQTGNVHTAIRMWLGLTTADLHTIGTPTTQSVCAFRYDTSVDTGTTNWRAVSSTGTPGQVQTTDTGVNAAVTGAGLRFMIQTSVTTITFWINDVIVATHSTFVPANVDLGHTAGVTTLDAANKRFDFGRAFFMHSEFGL